MRVSAGAGTRGTPLGLAWKCPEGSWETQLRGRRDGCWRRCDRGALALTLGLQVGNGLLEHQWDGLLLWALLLEAAGMRAVSGVCNPSRPPGTRLPTAYSLLQGDPKLLVGQGGPWWHGLGGCCRALLCGFQEVIIPGGADERVRPSACLCTRHGNPCLSGTYYAMYVTWITSLSPHNNSALHIRK